MEKSFYTIGYGGRKKDEFIQLLSENPIQIIIDVRLSPDRSSMGYAKKAKTSDKGIEKILGELKIEYYSFKELGNPFFEDKKTWRSSYVKYLEDSGYSMFSCFNEIQSDKVFCLLCAEKKVSNCHREQISEHLQRTGYQLIKHIE